MNKREKQNIEFKESWHYGSLHEDISIEDLKKKHPSRPNKQLTIYQLIK